VEAPHVSASVEERQHSRKKRKVEQEAEDGEGREEDTDSVALLEALCKKNPHLLFATTAITPTSLLFVHAVTPTMPGLSHAHQNEDSAHHILPLGCRDNILEKASRWMGDSAILLSSTAVQGVEHVDSGRFKEDIEAGSVYFAMCNCEGRAFGSSYAIPRGAAFSICDVEAFPSLVPFVPRCGFDIIEIDPPWENHSVHRGKKYSTLPEHRLLHIPLRHFARGASLVCVWITNSKKVRRFVEDKLFKSNRIKMIGEWRWVKVDAAGNTMLPIPSQVEAEEGPNKKAEYCLRSSGGEVLGTSCTYEKAPRQRVGSGRLPTETVLLGIVQPLKGGTQSVRVDFEKFLPPRLDFASVPSTTHSKKPDIEPLLSHFCSGRANSEHVDVDPPLESRTDDTLPSSPPPWLRAGDPNSNVQEGVYGIEMFSRRLRPGWLSIGHQPLYFHLVDKDEQS